MRLLSPHWGSSSVGRHGRAGEMARLVYRKAVRPAPPRPPAPVVQKLVRQTVVNLCQVSHQHILHHTALTQQLHTSAFFLLLPPPQSRERQELESDRSRPTRAAQRLLHLFSMESARRQLRPYYSHIVRSVLKEEQERYQSRPTQAISLIWNLFGRQQAFRTLTRFYLSAVEKLGSNYYPALHGQNALYLAAGVMLHSQVYRRYVRQFWNREDKGGAARYVSREQDAVDELMQLRADRWGRPFRAPVEEAAHAQQDAQAPQEAVRVREAHLSEADFRALVRGVAATLGRQSRLEALRRGGT